MKARKESRPVPVRSLDFRSKKDLPKKRGPSNFKPLSTINEDSVSALRTHLVDVCHRNQHSAIFLFTEDQPSISRTPPSIPQLVSNFHQSNSASILDFLTCNTSESDIQFFRELDQEDSAWMEARTGRITASLAGDVHGLRDSSEAKSFVQRVMGTQPAFTSHATEYGKKHESVARHMYETKMSSTHTSFRCTTTGLHISKELPFLGASPDGLSTCQCHDKRVVEIKCSAKHKDLRARDIPHADPTYHLEYRDGQLCLKTKSKWYLQMQFQMGILGLTVCDFVFYTRHSVEVMPIAFDEQLWMQLKDKATRVWINIIFSLL